MGLFLCAPHLLTFFFYFVEFNYLLCRKWTSVAKGDCLGEFEQLVMLALIRLGPNAYGMTVRRELEERAERHVAIGAVYATLDRLEGKGYVNSSESSGGPERGGRAKRYFKITGAGAHALNNSHETLQKMWRGIKLVGEET